MVQDDWLGCVLVSRAFLCTVAAMVFWEVARGVLCGFGWLLGSC